MNGCRWLAVASRMGSYTVMYSRPNRLARPMKVLPYGASAHTRDACGPGPLVGALASCFLSEVVTRT